MAIDVLAGDLTIGGPVTSNSSIDAVVIRASGSIIVNGSSGGAVNGGGITLAAAFDFANGTINAAGAGGIALGGSLFSSFDGGSSPIALGAGTGGIRQTAGVIQGTTLTVQSGGGASLTSTGAGFFTSNEINVLGPSTVAANFSLAAFKLASFGTAGVGGDLQLTGDIRAGGTLSLLALDTGMQELSGSRIFAARLDASARATGAPGAGGSITFGGDNQVAVLGTVNGFGVAVRNVVGLDIAGPVVGNGVVTIAVASGDLLVSGAVSALGSNLSLTAGGNVTVGGTGVATATVGDGGGRVSIFAGGRSRIVLVIGL